jgi:uncharacterized protein YodC (DUF2158 family)
LRQRVRSTRIDRRTFHEYDDNGAGRIRMSDVSIKPGDVVRLNSGGPAMTVRVVERGVVLCDWFDGTKKCEDKFPAATLSRDSSFETQQPRW